MQRRRAVRHGAGVLRANELRELTFEGCDLGPLSDPSGQDDAPNCLDFLFVEDRFRYRNLLNRLCHRFTIQL